MSYIPIKKDLIEGTVNCYFCNRPLTSLKTYILENLENNELVNAGPTCAEKNIVQKYDIRLIPDLSKYTETSQKEKPEEFTNRSNKGRRNNSTLTLVEENLRAAIEYLELREDKLAELFHTSYPILKAYYIIYKSSRHLDIDSVKHILNIEKNAPEKYKIQNLQKCYNYSFWLSIRIVKIDKEANSFLTQVYEYLKKT